MTEVFIREKKTISFKIRLGKIKQRSIRNKPKSSRTLNLYLAIVKMKYIDETTIKSINFSIKLLLTIKINCFNLLS